MKSAIKKAIVTTLLGLSLGFVGMGSARAQDYADNLQAYLADTPDLSYQIEMVDCGIAEKMAAKGAWWVMMNPNYVADETIAVEAELTVVADDEITSSIINNFDRPLSKGAQELRNTYKGFFVAGAGGEISDYRKEPRNYNEMGAKEKRGRAKIIGIQVKTVCERAKKAEGGQEFFKGMLAGYKMVAGEF